MSRKEWIKKLDEIWSLIIRSKKRCELCGHRDENIGSFDAHHIKRKGRSVFLRWKLENGACLGKGCHRYKVHMDNFSAYQLVEKLRKKRGEEWWQFLEKSVERTVKWHEDDLRKIYNKLKKKLCENNMFKVR